MMLGQPQLPTSRVEVPIIGLDFYFGGQVGLFYITLLLSKPALLTDFQKPSHDHGISTSASIQILKAFAKK